MGEDEDKGYTVEDRRYLHLSEEEKAKLREKAGAKEAAAETAFQEASQKAAAEADKTAQEMPLPEITFSSLIFSLSSSAFVSLGAIPDPNTGQGGEESAPGQADHRPVGPAAGQDPEQPDPRGRDPL